MLNRYIIEYDFYGSLGKKYTLEVASVSKVEARQYFRNNYAKHCRIFYIRKVVMSNV